MSDSSQVPGMSAQVPGAWRITYQSVAQKCPACDGWGKRRTADWTRASEVDCPACKGAGVLWPPREER